MNTFQNQYKFEPIGESRTNAFLFIYVSVFRVCPQFANPSVFLCYAVSSVSHTPTVFILFITVSVFRVAHRATALHSYKAVESSLS